LFFTLDGVDAACDVTIKIEADSARAVLNGTPKVKSQSILNAYLLQHPFGRRTLITLWLLLSATSLLFAQASSQHPDSSPHSPAELTALQQALLRTQEQVALQQQEIELLIRRLASREPTAGSTQNIDADAVSPAPRSTAAHVETNDRARPLDQGEGEKKAPISSLKIGDAVLTIGGFVDLENVFRTTNTGNNVVTNFAAIPFSNTAQGHLSEFRTTAQYSRLNLKVTDRFGLNYVTGYIETDFSGNDAANVYQSVNGHTNRLRLYFMDLKRAKWEFLGGQTWSWLTPNRTGLGPMPSDLAITYNEDQNIGVGLPYTRAAGFRVAYHPSTTGS
jgi:hypothetical protein